MQKFVTFNAAIHAVADEVAELVVKKQYSYGTKNILNCPFGAEHGIIVRLHDKLARLTNLTSHNKNPEEESIEDSWKDVVGYALIAIMVRRGVFELPLAEKPKSR